jgi:hypothetical protein
MEDMRTTPRTRPIIGVVLGVVFGLAAGWFVASVQTARVAAKADSDLCAKQMQINELKEQLSMLKYRLGDSE